MVNLHKASNVINFVISFALIVDLASCNYDEPNFALTEEEDSLEWYNADLYFNPIFGNQESRASSEVRSYEPSDNDLLVISFDQTGGETVKGYAKYHAQTQQWELSYLGSLESCSNETCQLIYIGNNPTFYKSTRRASFGAESAVFECYKGIYDFSGGNINLYATLSPLTSRVRFKGNKESSFELKGFVTYNKFTLSDWQLLESDYLDVIPCNVSNSSEGYFTPYYYINHYSDRPWIKDGDSVYLWKKNLSDEILTEGASGLINLPSIDADGWLSDTYRTKSIPAITISATTHGSWTQTQSQTRFYSKVGIRYNFTYTIKSQGSGSFTDIPFIICCFAYDENGDYLNCYEYDVYDDEIELNKEIDYCDYYYHEGASYYEIQFYEYQTSAKITYFNISTF